MEKSVHPGSGAQEEAYRTQPRLSTGGRVVRTIKFYLIVFHKCGGLVSPIRSWCFCPDFSRLTANKNGMSHFNLNPNLIKVTSYPVVESMRCS